MIAEVNNILKTEVVFHEIFEAKKIIQKYEYLSERLESISSSINRLEDMKNEIIREFEMVKKSESELYARCREKYGSDFDLIKEITKGDSI